MAPLGIYSEDIRINMYDIDAAGNPRISRLTERLLLCASTHMELLDWEWSRLAKELGVCVVLADSRVRLTGDIKLGDRLKITTWTIGRLYPMMTRGFAITGCEGKVVFESVMRSVLMDIESRSLANPSNYNLTAADQNFEAPAISLLATRPAPIRKVDAEGRTPDFCREHTVNYGDLDYNGHMNTAKYAECVENLFGAGSLFANPLTGLDVRYEKEIPPDSTLKTVGFYDAERGATDIAGTSGGAARFYATAYRK